MAMAGDSLLRPTTEGPAVVELVLLACLIKEPRHCKTFRIPFGTEMQTPQCLWQSQFQVARWAGDHPAWVVKKVSCEMPEA
jgi:hypothetical protein